MLVIAESFEVFGSAVIHGQGYYLCRAYRDDLIGEVWSSPVNHGHESYLCWW